MSVAPLLGVLGAISVTAAIIVWWIGCAAIAKHGSPEAAMLAVSAKASTATKREIVLRGVGVWALSIVCSPAIFAFTLLLLWWELLQHLWETPMEAWSQVVQAHRDGAVGLGLARRPPPMAALPVALKVRLEAPCSPHCPVCFEALEHPGCPCGRGHFVSAEICDSCVRELASRKAEDLKAAERETLPSSEKAS